MHRGRDSCKLAPAVGYGKSPDSGVKNGNERHDRNEGNYF